MFLKKMLNGPIENIVLKDIQSLIDNKYKENQFIEYKGGDFLSKKKKTKEFRDNPKNKNKTIENDKFNLAKKIAGFANTSGGLIIIGINERKNIPQKISPISIDKMEIILSKVLMNYLHPFEYQEFHTILVDNMKEKESIYVIRVNKSKTMIQLKHNNEGGYIPLRVNEETKIADIEDIYNIIERKKDSMHLEKAAFEIFQAIAFYLEENHINIEVRENYFKRIFDIYADFFPKLGILVEECSNNIDFIVLDKYSLYSGSEPQKISKNNYKNVGYVEILINLLLYWKNYLGIIVNLERYNKISQDTIEQLKFKYKIL